MNATDEYTEDRVRKTFMRAYQILLTLAVAGMICAFWYDHFSEAGRQHQEQRQEQQRINEQEKRDYCREALGYCQNGEPVRVEGPEAQLYGIIDGVPIFG